GSDCYSFLPGVRIQRGSRAGTWMAFCSVSALLAGVLCIVRLHMYFDDTGFMCHPDKTMVSRTS
ncbi:TPA: hypothetical protein ACGWIT_003254, partial [Salmonella enterica]